MRAFATAMRLIFADRNMAVDAVWYPAGGLPPVPVRLVPSAPDEVQEFNGARLVSGTLRAQARLDQMPNPAKGDRVEIGAQPYAVQAVPQKDAQNLTWAFDLVPVP